MDVLYSYIMLSSGYVLCDGYFIETWNTPGTKDDNAQLCYLDKIAGRRSSLDTHEQDTHEVLKLRAKEGFNGLFLKGVWR